MFLLSVIQEFNNAKIPYVLVGGYALAFQGIVRATVDIDLVVSLSEKQLIKAEQVLSELGLESRIPVRAKDIAQFHGEYRTKRNLIAWSFVNPKDPTQQVDLLIHPPMKSVKSQVISVHGVKMRIATKQALLAMKRSANRPEDQLDIQRLEEALRNEKS